MQMLYIKNVPNWERALRVAMGAGLIAASVAYFGPTTLGWITGLTSAMAAMSGLVGFCPACAMVGRQIKQ
jgi:hypothetical protein